MGSSTGARRGGGDDLNLPYAAGSTLDMVATGIAESDAVGWTIVSADPGVLRVDTTRDGRAQVTAVGPGVTEVRLLDADGGLRHRAEIEVRRADRAELAAYGPEIVERPELQQDGPETRVLVGGEAAFPVYFYEGGERLHGNGSLAVDAPGAIPVEVRRSYLFEDRDWLIVRPGSAGTYDIQLLANGLPVQQVRIVAVLESAVDHLALYGMDDSEASSGAYLTVLAQPYDVEGTPIFGAEFAWLLDGVFEEGFGDLYRYRYDPRQRSVLEAREVTSDRAATVTIHADQGWVDSTSDAACSVVGVGMPGRGVGGLAAACLLLVAMARWRGDRSRIAGCSR